MSNIDKTAPAAPTVKLSSTKAAKSITVTATFSKDSAKKQYSTDGTTWKTYSKALTVTANGTYYFRGVDAAGNKSKVRSAKVTNIVDTGNTIVTLKNLLEELGAARIFVTALLLKPEVYKKDVKLDYVAMSIPNRFIVGFGLDYNELGRNTEDIYVLDS